MGDPFKKSEDPVNGAVGEIISAMSSLNMEPKPMDKPEGDYLSETDFWAYHAMEHLRAAIDLLRRVDLIKESVDSAVGFLEAGAAPQALEVLRIAQAKMRGEEPAQKL